MAFAGMNYLAIVAAAVAAFIWGAAYYMALSKQWLAAVGLSKETLGNKRSPVPFITKHHARVTHVHIKDRKKNNGANTPFGEGDTPIKEVLQMMKKDKLTFPANIELEYPIPPGSNSPAEIAKCLAFAKQALES